MLPKNERLHIGKYFTVRLESVDFARPPPLQHPHLPTICLLLLPTLKIKNPYISTVVKCALCCQGLAISRMIAESLSCCRFHLFSASFTLKKAVRIDSTFCETKLYLAQRKHFIDSFCFLSTALLLWSTLETLGAGFKLLLKFLFLIISCALCQRLFCLLHHILHLRNCLSLFPES